MKFDDSPQKKTEGPALTPPKKGPALYPNRFVVGGGSVRSIPGKDEQPPQTSAFIPTVTPRAEAMRNLEACPHLRLLCSWLTLRNLCKAPFQLLPLSNTHLPVDLLLAAANHALDSELVNPATCSYTHPQAREESSRWSERNS